MFRFLFPAVALCLAIAVGSESAGAQPSPELRAAAVGLFDEGRKLAAAGQYEQACPKFAESQRMDPGVGTLYNLSDCYEHIGRTASAWTGFRDVAAAAAQTGQVDREKVARERFDRLTPRLTRVRVLVPEKSRVQGLTLLLAGAPLREVMWGVPLPVDPGRVTLRASAPGRTDWDSTIEAKGEGAVVDAEVPPLTAAAAAPTAPTPAISAPPEPGSVAKPPERDAPTSLRRPLALVVGGVGVATMAVGVGIGLAAKSKHDDANCNDDGFCDQAGLTAREDAVTMGNVGTVLFIGGAALAAGGAVLFFTAPSGRTVAARVSGSRLSLTASF